MLWSAEMLPGRPAGGRLLLLEPSELAFEVSQLLEVLVDAREAQVRDLVELREVPKDLHANVLAGDFRPAPAQVLLHPVHQRRHLLLGDRAVRDGLPDAGDDLGPVVGLAHAGALHDAQAERLHALHGREAPLARAALPAAADRLPSVDRTGVHDSI